MWEQLVNPLNNLYLSALIASIPIIFLFIVLLSRKIPGYIACIMTLIIALAISVFIYTMPVILALTSAFYGMIFGIFPIAWIVLNVVFLYNISIKTGSFAVVKNSIESITADRRLQALLIAFCFGAFLEGAAGFGAPVAITAGMLVGIGFAPLYAAGICLIANTAPVAFGGVGLPVITAGHLTNIDPAVLSHMIANQLPLIAFILPLWLVALMSGFKGLKGVWPAVLVTGASYAITMYLVARFLGPTLPDVLSAIVSIISLVILLHFWQPKEIWRFPKERTGTPYVPQKYNYKLSDLIRGWSPFILLIIFIANWGLGGTQSILNKLTINIHIEPLDRIILANGDTLSVNYAFNWLGATGTAILFAAIISAIILKMNWKDFFITAKETLVELFKPLITISSIVGFAFVLNYSGMATSIGNALALSGVFFPFISPIIGWIGVFITGSDTSSNALFAKIQFNTAESLGINPVLTVAANSTGGVAAKMISLQSIAVAIAATKLSNQEGRIFRFTILHSIALVLIIATITFIQAYFLKWMIPDLVTITAGSIVKNIKLYEIGIILTSLIIIIALASFVVRRKIVSEEKHALQHD